MMLFNRTMILAELICVLSLLYATLYKKLCLVDKMTMITINDSLNVPLLDMYYHTKYRYIFDNLYFCWYSKILYNVFVGGEECSII